MGKSQVPHLHGVVENQLQRCPLWSKGSQPEPDFPVQGTGVGKRSHLSSGWGSQGDPPALVKGRLLGIGHPLTDTAHKLSLMHTPPGLWQRHSSRGRGSCRVIRGKTE